MKEKTEMTRRVSAGELEFRYKLKHILLDFFDSMKAQMYENLEDKGFSWKTCDIKSLQRKLREHIKAENWVDVANYAFMLNNRKETLKP